MKEMEEETKKAYSEVIEVLKLIDEDDKFEKLPFEFVQLLKRNADPTYKPYITKEIPLEEQNLKNETYKILAWIADKYWGKTIYEEIKEDDEINDNIEELTTENEEIEEIEKEKDKENEVYVYTDIEEESLEGQNLPFVIDNLKWYEKIKIKVINLFKSIFKIKHKEEIGEV